ncbi:PGF-CTERM sorting domain-containing protein [Halomicrococcus sp. SG-WS-1]|uniref:PGF-CTERM sorting domain-containing protein n=1 Tax=Halomicrococcus sp. SG-WS-1 TaxID=3439057 RepID=UPI003F7A83A2
MEVKSLRAVFATEGWYAILAIVLLLVAPVAIANAAETSTVTLDATNARVDASETTTVDIVANDITGGVGAYSLSVELTDPSVATITNVEFAGDPKYKTVEIANDGSRATIRAAVANTTDSGSAKIVSVTVRGDDDGSTNIDLAVSVLTDEDGSKYATETNGASLTVFQADDDESDDDDDTSDDEDTTTTTTTDGEDDDETTTDGTDEPTSSDETTTSTTDDENQPSTTSTSSPAPTTNNDGQPGFGVVIALVALLAAAHLVTRRAS